MVEKAAKDNHLARDSLWNVQPRCKGNDGWLKDAVDINLNSWPVYDAIKHSRNIKNTEQGRYYIWMWTSVLCTNYGGIYYPDC